jgi:hypothetical protein
MLDSIARRSDSALSYLAWNSLFISVSSYLSTKSILMLNNYILSVSKLKNKINKINRLTIYIVNKNEEMSEPTNQWK